MLQGKFGVKCDTVGGVFTISGEDAEKVKQCKAALKGIGGRGFCTLLYEDFNEAFVSAHPQFFPGIIGSKGTIINAVRRSSRSRSRCRSCQRSMAPRRPSNHDCRFCEAC